MNLTKSQDYFNPVLVNRKCHIIGCGSVGSTVAELLVRLGITNISLYDFDVVSSHNLANQMFNNADIGRLKVDAVKDMCIAINPDCKFSISTFEKGYCENTALDGYVFLCVDNIDLRREIASKNKMNKSVLAMFDFRTGLVDAQHYAADWSKPLAIRNFLSTMDFTHEEARNATPVSACNVEMGVAPTVRIICSYGVANFMNFIREKQIKSTILINAFEFYTDAF